MGSEMCIRDSAYTVFDHIIVEFIIMNAALESISKLDYICRIHIIAASDTAVENIIAAVTIWSNTVIGCIEN